MELILGYASQAEFRKTHRIEGKFQSRNTVVESLITPVESLFRNVVSSG